MLFDKRRTGKSAFGLIGNIVDIIHRGMHHLGFIEQIESIPDYKLNQVVDFNFKDCCGKAVIVCDDFGHLYLEVLELVCEVQGKPVIVDNFGDEYESRGDIDV